MKLKVGDIVGFRHLRNQPHRGVVVGFGTFMSSNTPSVSVFWFETAEKTAASPGWLFKVEDRGV
tara:strand:- start:901 stop:1092 length:192 start_codon:yes stop_codon:yes gene_type:complete